MQIVAGANSALAPGSPIELAFDRLLMPSSIVRQTFVLADLRGNALNPPSAVAYDPVARIVTVTPRGDALQPDETYRLFITSPTGSDDPNGLRAIDGAGLDPKWSTVLTFPVLADAGAAAARAPLDFCRDVFGTFKASCAGAGCHGGPSALDLPAAGLLLTSLDGIRQTAFDRASQALNTGPSAGPGLAADAPFFARDMPLVDVHTNAQSGGNPGNSFVIYKLLMAKTAPASPTPAAPPAHALSWTPISADERQRLQALAAGRGMPYPSDPGAPLDVASPTALSTDQLEAISTWIASGAPLPSACP